MSTKDIEERVARANALRKYWEEQRFVDATLYIKAETWILEHPHHPKRREQINKYFLLLSKYYEMDFWYGFCQMMNQIGYTVLEVDGKEVPVMGSAVPDLVLLREKPECLLAEEFALSRSKYL